MSYYSIPLKAGIPFKQNTIGTLLLIDSTGVADGVDVTLTRKTGSEGVKMPARKNAFRLVEQYDAVTFTSAVDTTLGVFLSTADVQLGFVNGGAVTVPGGVNVTNDAAHPVNVTFTQQIVPLGSVTVNNPSASPVPTKAYQAQAITNVAPVAVTAAGVALVAADATRRGLRLRNVGANPVALIGQGGTYANAAIVIQPGETWNEPEAPGAAWYGICDVGLSSTLNILTVS